jgi:hypothetical protein
VPARLLDLCQTELLEAMNRGWGGRTASRRRRSRRSAPA